MPNTFTYLETIFNMFLSVFFFEKSYADPLTYDSYEFLALCPCVMLKLTARIR